MFFPTIIMCLVGGAIDCAPMRNPTEFEDRAKCEAFAEGLTPNELIIKTNKDAGMPVTIEFRGCLSEEEAQLVFLRIVQMKLAEEDS